MIRPGSASDRLSSENSIGAMGEPPGGWHPPINQPGNHFLPTSDHLPLFQLPQVFLLRLRRPRCPSAAGAPRGKPLLKVHTRISGLVRVRAPFPFADPRAPTAPLSGFPPTPRPMRKIRHPRPMAPQSKTSSRRLPAKRPIVRSW
jgi:hypothetical protein